MEPTNAGVPLPATEYDAPSTPRPTVTPAVGPGAAAVDGSLSPDAVPGYRIEGELGRGGMGIVYKACQLALKRPVALKMVLAGGAAGSHEAARFRVEAEAAGRLQHPNIVQIHEVGEVNGHPYCALELVEGGNLADRIAGKPQPARAAAQLVEALARGMQLAHSRNVVHRDLKPANILLAADGTPKISDFGLARQLDSDSSQTQAGMVMGTPSYMAPEQASGRANEAGPAADVYALGAILYEALTGRPPFQGKTVVDTLDQVRTQEPAPPSRWRADVPLDLDTICLKCLRKEPEHRYTSAAALADDLVRYGRGEPIQARPISRLERARKWVQRNPGLAASLAGLVGLFLAAFVLVTWSYVRTESALKEEADQRRAADAARDTAQQNEKAERWGRYRSLIATASGALRLQNSGTGRSALDEAPPEHRNWEWDYLHNQLDSAALVLPVPGGKYQAHALSPSGRQVAVCGADQNEVYLFELATGRTDAVLRGHTAPAAAVAFRPDGKEIATSGADQTIRLWDPATGRQTARLTIDAAPTEVDHIPNLLYSPDGSRLVSSAQAEAGGASRLWDVTTGKLVTVLGKWQERGQPVAFCDGGKRVAAGSGDVVKLVDAVTGRGVAVLGPHPKRVAHLACSPDGRRIAVATELGADAIHLWDGESGRQVAVLVGHTAPVTTLVFSPDGSRLASGSQYPDGTARLWDAASGRRLPVLAGHKNEINGIAFSPDGRRVVTVSSDQTGRLWDAGTGQPVAVLVGHTDRVRHARFSPDGSRVVTAGDDATLRLWDGATGDGVSVLRGHGDRLPLEHSPDFTPDGTRLVSAALDGTLRVWDRTLVERNGLLRGHTSFVYDVAFHPDGNQVASAAWDGTVRLWDATTGQETGRLPHGTKIVSSVAYHHDGRLLAAGERERGITLWDVATQRPARRERLLAPVFWDGRTCFDATGKLLASSSGDGPVRLWDVAAGQVLAELRGHDTHAVDVAFSPAGTLLASASSDGTVRLWDVAGRAPAGVLHGHTDYVARVAFSPDGRTLASGSGDKTVRLWDVETRDALASIPLGSIVYAVAFSPDGTRLAAACRDNTVRLIDVATRQPVAELYGHTDYVHAVAWSPDGTRLVSGSGDFTVRVWDSLSPAARARR